MQSDTLDAVIVYAKLFANNKKMPEVLASHVLYALASVNNEAKKYLDMYGLTAQRLEPKEIGRVKGAVESDELKTLRRYAARLAYELGSKDVNCVHLLIAILAYRETYAYDKIVYLLDKQEKTPDDLFESIMEELPDREKIAAFIRGGDKLGLRMTESEKRTAPPTVRIEERLGSIENKDVVLEHAAKQNDSDVVPFSEDLTAKALVGGIDPVIGRETETERVIQTLTRRTKNNPVLVGEAGVGKTAVVEGLALAIAEGRVPSELQGKRLIELDIAGMVAGTRYRGDFEERLTNFVSQVVSRGDTILFIDEIHNLVGAGSSKDGSMGAAEILKPALARGELRVIGATTTREYRQYIEKDPALERRFQPITVEEPDEETAVRILKGVKSKYEKHHGVEITDDAIVTAVQLSVRYVPDRSLPDKAFDIIDEACSKLKISTYSVPPRLVELANQLNLIKRKLNTAEDSMSDEELASVKKRYDELYFEYEYAQNEYEELKGYKCKLTPKDVRAVVSQMTGVPVSELSRAERDKLAHLEEELAKRVIGQKQAVQAVARAVRRQRAGLKDPNRPIGSFIFVGPTGVGKTELAKALSECLFGSTSEVIRVDMSEYMDKQSAAKLIGAPPGYVGYEESGYLTGKVKSKPYSVVLFDEIEKAHPDVFNLLLQILDEGRLTDSHGKTVDFRNTVIILTSNIGLSDRNGGFMGFSNADSYSYMREKVEYSLKKFFRPEFLNRLDETIVFDYLTEEETLKITELLCFSLYKRVRGMINIKFRDKAVKKLAQEGYDKAYGARPLKRAIQRDVEDPLAEKIISGEIKKGDTVMVDIDGGEIIFKVLR